MSKHLLAAFTLKCRVLDVICLLAYSGTHDRTCEISADAREHGLDGRARARDAALHPRIDGCRVVIGGTGVGGNCGRDSGCSRRPACGIAGVADPLAAGVAGKRSRRCMLGVAVVARQWWRQGRSVLGASGQRLALCLLPCVAAGAALTAVDLSEGHLHAIAGTWLMLFGCALIATSVLTVRVLAWLGALFMAFGALALWLPTSVHNLLLGAGFGGLHLLFGAFLVGRATHER
jgi:hypothetical protein